MLKRVEIVDLMRGLVVALMVLDHTREYFSAAAGVFSPTDPEQTTLAFFVTRWATHLCAPTFVFLAGASIRLRQAGGGDLQRFLLVRGVWLLALEFTVIGFGFNFAEPILFFQVIWAIGFSMVLMSVLVRAPPASVGALGLAIIAGHGLFSGIDAARFGAAAPLYELMMAPGPAPFLPGIIAYPALPWFGILAVGYASGGCSACRTRQDGKSCWLWGARAW
jgi:uncharacterized membrane protein